jgi:signal transduction histidine kinase/HPt (histidine-containing phosphotransfer) domain-containing protein
MPDMPTRVLIIEDSPSDAGLVQEHLAAARSTERFHMEVAVDLKAGLARLATEAFDVVLLDLNLPDSFGLETFESLHARFPELPVVIMSSAGTEELAVRAVAAGAQDYIFKDSLEPQLLMRCLRYSISRAQVLRELVEARRLAQEASRHKSQFLATMSHEIRTPMTGVIGAAELLLATPLGRTQRDLAEVIKGSGETLLALINGVLDLAKIEAGRMELEAVPVDPRRLVSEVAATFVEPAAAKGLVLLTAVDAAVPERVLGDPVKLRQILMNLVGNAVKFTKVGTIAIRVALPRSEDQQRLVFEVEDTGIGMTAATRERIFEAFTQADSSTTRLYGGTGLGLAIARRLVELMKGALTVESAPGEGSVFRFSVEAAPVLPVAWRERQGELGRLAVLCDEPRLRKGIVRQLAAAGFAPVALGSGEQQRIARIIDDGVAGAVAVEPAGMSTAEAESFRARLAALQVRVAVVARSRDSLPAYPADGTRLQVGYAMLPQPTLEWLESGVGALAEAAGEAAAQGEEPAGGGYPMRVLVVEDYEINQRVILAILASLGCRPTLAGSGAEALVKFAGDAFDLVLMDCQMPEMDGYETTRRIRKLEEGSGSRLPIVAMTAGALKGDRERCLQAGMDDYMTKPVRMAEVAKILEQWRPRPAAGRPAAEPRVDRETLESLAELRAATGRDVLGEVLGIFDERSATLLNDLERAVVEGPATRVRHLAHTLKGGASQVGAVDVASRCDELESLAAESGAAGVSSPRARELVSRLRLDLAGARAALARERARLSAPP